MDVNKGLSVVYDEENQKENYQNEIAKDLNSLIGQAQYELETDEVKGHELASATLRIVKRVHEFEEIKTV